MFPPLLGLFVRFPPPYANELERYTSGMSAAAPLPKATEADPLLEACGLGAVRSSAMGMEKSPAIRGGHWGGRPAGESCLKVLARAYRCWQRMILSTTRITCHDQAGSMTTHWYRSVQVNNGYQAGYLWMCAIPSGATYRRIRWSWGFTGVTADTVDIYNILLNVQIAGLVTTIGDGTEIPPNAALASGDVDPPTQRWLWWETRQPVPIAVDHAAGIITWRDSGPQEVPDVKTQVLATGIPGGDTLNLWFSWQSGANAPWDPSGSQLLWVSTAVLYTT